MDITFPRSAMARLAATITAVTMSSLSRPTVLRRNAEPKPGRAYDVEKTKRAAERMTSPVAGTLLDARVGPIGPYLGVSRR